MKNLLLILCIVTSSCSVLQPPSETPGLGGVTWTLTAIEKRPVSFGDKAILRFEEEEDRISGKAVCNSFFGEYERSSNKIKFDGIGSTKMFCEGTMDEESQIISSLQGVNRFEIKLNFLYLYAGEKLVLTYKK